MDSFKEPTQTALPTIVLNGKTYAPRVLRFVNGQLALLLKDEHGDERRVGIFVKDATPDIPVGESIRNAELVIKNYTEFEGIDDALVKAGILLPAHRHVPAGFVEAPVMRLGAWADHLLAENG